ncbi:hypothetical protein D3C83_44460 [compost metagenome]
MNAPIAGSTLRPIASLTAIAGKSAPAWIVSGMPPEKRGLISKIAGWSPRMRHWMLIGPTNAMAAQAARASSMSRGSFTVRPRSITPARMTTRSRGTIDSGVPRRSHITSMVYSGPERYSCTTGAST